MSVKFNKSQSLLMQRLQGLMESNDIPQTDVEALVQNPAELQKLMVESGDTTGLYLGSLIKTPPSG